MEANLGFNKTAKGNDGKLVKLKKKRKVKFYFNNYKQKGAGI